MKTLLLHRITITAYCCITLTAHTYSMDKIFNHSQQDTKKTPSVLHNTGISEGEKEFLKKRLPVVKAALEKMLKRDLTNNLVPNIALVGSGGGYRAMFCTTGSLCGAQKIGLLDATTYLTALSGSTWAVAPWISTSKPINEFKKYLKECAAKPFDELTLDEKILIVKALEKKIENKQPITLVDPYGNLLGNRLLESLGKKRQKTTLSQQAEKIANGTYPYPIYTSIDGRETVVTGQTWYEFTPHTVGDRTNNTQISTSTYGKKFKKGTVVNNAPEKSLAYCMGTWGSAFGANVHEIIKELISNDETLKIIFELLPDSIGGDRLLPFYAKVSNYMYKMDAIKDTTLVTEKHMEFVDAGLEINLPYPPVSGICPERSPNILIFLDASAGHIGNELHKVDNYAKKYNLPFPIIDYDNIDKKTISIFKDEDNKAAPIIIYMPRISDKDLWEQYKDNPEFTKYNLSGFDLDYETNNGYCATQHFQYTPEQSTPVMNQTEFNMCVNKDAIIETINWWIDRKS